MSYDKIALIFFTLFTGWLVIINLFWRQGRLDNYMYDKSFDERSITRVTVFLLTSVIIAISGSLFIISILDGPLMLLLFVFPLVQLVGAWLWFMRLKNIIASLKKGIPSQLQIRAQVAELERIHRANRAYAKVKLRGH